MSDQQQHPTDETILDQQLELLTTFDLTPTSRRATFDILKETCGGALLVFHLGPMCEFLYEDAETVTAILPLKVYKTPSSGIPMAGFPEHHLDQFLAQLLAAGHRVAVCEQVAPDA